MLSNTDRLVTKAAADYTIRVGATDSEYTSIQEAINHAVDKDVIFVKPGVYNENLVVNKLLTIYAEDSDNTTITGDGVTPAVHITAPGGAFKQFGITALSNNQTGIFLDNSASIDSFLIEGCACFGNKNGIELNNSKNNNIGNNVLTGNRQFGILLRDGSDNNTVSANIATGNADGIGVNNSTGNVGEENNVTGNVNTGYSFVYASGNNFSECTTKSNNIGMYFQNSTNNRFHYNEVVDNLDAIKMVASSSNTVESNTILERTVGSSITLDADCSSNRINHNTYRIPAIDLGTDNVFVNNHSLSPSLQYDVATVRYVNSMIQPGGESSDVVCGVLRAINGATLKWKFYSSNHIRLYNTDVSAWEIIEVGTEPTAANTDQDMCGDVLAADLVYDVFAVYNSTLTSFDITFAPWKIVSTDGANNPGTTTCTTTMTSDVTPVPEVVSASSELYGAWNAFSDDPVRYWSSTPTPLATSAFIKYDFNVPTIVNKYALKSNQNIAFPTTFSLAGSNNDIDYTLLDSRTGIVGPGDDAWTTYYTFNNGTAYRYYKLVTNCPADAGYGAMYVELTAVKLVRGLPSNSRANYWITGTNYRVGDRVIHGDAYICLVAHTADDFATDLASGRWVLGDPCGLGIFEGVPVYADSGVYRSYRWLGMVSLYTQGGAANFSNSLISNFYNPIDRNKENGDVVVETGALGNVVLGTIDFPRGDGLPGQVLETDGAGHLNWVNNGADLLSTDVVGGNLHVASPTNLTWNYVESNEIRLFNGSINSWQTVRCATPPSASNIVNDMDATPLMSHRVYDVFGFFRTDTVFELEFAPWKFVPSDGIYNPGTTTCTAKMTGFNSPTPNAIITSSTGVTYADIDNTYYYGWYAFSQLNNNVGWAVQIGGYSYTPGDPFQQPMWITYDFGPTTKKVINKYAWKAKKYYPSLPRDWMVSGSNDNVNWSILDTKVGIDPPPGIGIWSQYFTFNNAIAYRFYRIDVTACTYPWQCSYWYVYYLATIGEIVLIESNAVAESRIDTWLSGVHYGVGTRVSHSYVYACVSSHVSYDFDTDLAAGRWIQVDSDGLATLDGVPVYVPSGDYKGHRWLGTIVMDDNAGTPVYNPDRLTNFYNLIERRRDGEQVTISGEQVGIGLYNPTARLHIKAGEAAPGGAPLKLTTGDVLAVPEPGAVEFIRDDVYFTITTDGARKGFVLNDGTRLTPNRIPFAGTRGRLVDSTGLSYSAADGLQVNGVHSQTDQDLLLDAWGTNKHVIISNLRFPNTDGTTGQVLVTDGLRHLSWSSNGVFGATGPIGLTGATGPSGGPVGATGSTGPVGSVGPIGPRGATGLGATGSTGPVGASGPAGGPIGATGEAGPVGATGFTGPRGSTGIGDIGSTGATGVPGSTGPSGGPVGATGATGFTGETGATGPAGGPTGATGATGIGLTGSTGAYGSTGATGLSGATGPGGGPTGATGPTGAIGATGMGASGSGAEGATGPAGQPGATGPSGGEPGATGTHGATGATGWTGFTGATGATGIGITGLPGASGAIGATGTHGSTGPSGGPIGATGTQGSSGISGSTGYSGATGATGVSVTGPPGATGPSGGPVGATGATGTAGGTGATGWGGATGTRGATGAIGLTGSTGLSGASGIGATGPLGPIGSSGATGFIGATGLPGASGPYGGPIGATGPSGASGATGFDGATGFTGATGLAGSTGVDGASGASGATGVQGASGTQGASGLAGATGIGASGATGIDGATGSTGPIGLTGATGIDGASGASGATGVQGASGIGASGVQGASGLTGYTGLTGSTGPQGATGAGLTGATGIDGASGATGVQGSTGPQGATGPGASGATGIGASGATGYTGFQGDPGPQGASGATGVQGASGIGATGLEGASGASGATGVQGASGAEGATGAGATGVDGASGATGIGATGPQGATGPGATGIDGASGATGADGATGPQGSTGPEGATGPGATGIDGASGATGVQGASGISGASGTIGVDGASGPTGSTGPIGATGIGASGATGFEGASGVVGASGPQGATGIDGATGPVGASGAIGVIGTPTIGDYTSGLFPWTPTTLIADAEQSVNEFMAALAPPLAPEFSMYDGTQLGVTGKMSYDASHIITDIYGVDGIGNLTAVNVDEAFTAAALTGMRRGIFSASTTTFTGKLASNVQQGTGDPTPAYPAYAFKDGDEGTLDLYINTDAAPTYSLDLAANQGSGTYVNGDGSGFVLTAVTSEKFPNGTDFTLFKYRTGTWVVGGNDLREGWNYIRITHTVGTSRPVVNLYLDFVRDLNTTATAFSSESMSGFSGTGSKYLSGVEFYTGGSATYNNTVDNLYRNTYYSGSDALAYTVTNAQAIASDTLATGAGDEAKQVVISKTAHLIASGTRLISQSMTVRTVAKRTVQTQQTSTGASISGILLDNVAATSTITLEGFDDENYRLPSGSDFDSSSTAVTGSWDSTISLVDSGSYPDGLQEITSQLVYPVADYSIIPNGPPSNVNYSTGVSGARTYYRFFDMSPTGRSNFMISVNGAGTIRANSYSMTNGSDDLKVDIKLPNGSAEGTGWLDVTALFISGNWADGDGCLLGGTFAMNTPLQALTVGTKNTAATSVNGKVFIRIRVPQAWTGNLTSITFAGV